jgi:hypothetical protein
MKKQLVLKFIKRYTKRKVVIKYLSNKELTENHPCQMSLKDDKVFIIELNRKWYLYNRDETLLKALLLHEVGHIEKYNSYCNRSMEEYLAQEWALKTALGFRLFRIRQKLLDMFNEWGSYKWNEENGALRRYIKAHTIWLDKMG